MKTYEITEQHIYGRERSKEPAPEGWEFTGEFRPRAGGTEMAISPSGYARFVYDAGEEHGPRLILRPKPKRKKFVLTETGEPARCPKLGEVFLMPDGRITTARHDFETDKYCILKFEEFEV